MIDLDSNPTKLIDIVEIGKQLLMTRGALTTFSIANDVAKYFAIIPRHLRRRIPRCKRELYGTGDAAKRGALGSYFQCAHHRRTDSTGAARRAVSSGRRSPIAAR